MNSNQRRSANYKPTIWNCGILQSLGRPYNNEKSLQRLRKLQENVKIALAEETDLLPKLEMIDRIQSLGLANHLSKELSEALDTIASIYINKYPTIGDDLYTSALCFRLLRQQGHQVSSDVFSGFLGKKIDASSKCNLEDVEGLIELLKACDLAMNGEDILDEAKVITTNLLKEVSSSSVHNGYSILVEEVAHALELPYHWRLQWFDVKRKTRKYEEEEQLDKNLLEFAKLNFNLSQAIIQEDLKELSKWWTTLGVSEKLDFTRDRLAESFLCAVGLAPDPRYSPLRKWLTKVVNLILIIDDVYDLYGSIQELQQFTTAVERWDPLETEQLPECMKICFQALYDVTNKTAQEMEEDNSIMCPHVLPYMRTAWGDFCKALYVEAVWYHKHYTPTVQEYISNAWISSSGPVILVHVLLATLQDMPVDPDVFLSQNHDLFYDISLVIRLCNDLGTTVAEQERGDAASSIICYQKEMNVTEEVAREHVKDMIRSAWKNINDKCFKGQVLSKMPGSFFNIVTNSARVAHLLYQNGDGFGVQDGAIKHQIVSLIVEPLKIS